MDKFDVIIVGAGPAGSIAGYILGQAGLDVLLIDKSTFPRRKVCGGGLAGRAFRQLPFDITPVIQRSVDRGYISFRGRVVAAIQDKSPIAYLVERFSFDDYLRQKAVSQGVIFLENQTVSDLRIKNNLLEVQTDQTIFYSNYVIGADGVHSLVARKCGLIPTRSTSLSYEARLTFPLGDSNDQIDAITFDFGALLGGYGWIFPKQDHLNVGVFRSWPGSRTNRNQLLRYIAQHPVLRKSDLIDIRAYPVPLGGKPNSLHHNQVLLVGDAANLADPWLGEGLFAAITSGRIAADNIVNHLTDQINDLSNYTRQVNAQLTRQWAYARRLSVLVHSFPYLNVKAMSASPTLQHMVIDLLRGNRTYQHIWSEIKTTFPSLFWQVIQRK